MQHKVAIFIDALVTNRWSDSAQDLGVWMLRGGWQLAPGSGANAGHYALGCSGGCLFVAEASCATGCSRGRHTLPSVRLLLVCLCAQRPAFLGLQSF